MANDPEPMVMVDAWLKDVESMIQCLMMIVVNGKKINKINCGRTGVRVHETWASRTADCDGKAESYWCPY